MTPPLDITKFPFSILFSFCAKSNQGRLVKLGFGLSINRRYSQGTRHVTVFLGHVVSYERGEVPV